MAWEPKDAVAVVTGASSGIGRCLTELLAQRGSIVLAIGRRRDRLQEVAESATEGRVIPVVGDITDPEIRAEIARQAAARLTCWSTTRESARLGRLPMPTNSGCVKSWRSIFLHPSN